MSKKIEEKYQELSEIEHVLLRSGMWIGSTKEEEKDMFIYDIDNGKIINKTITYIPGMLKVVDEVISNSCDEYRRSDNLGLTELKVTINTKKNRITIYDNGGIPIVKHKEAGIYIPQFIFGRLRTSSNYNDDEDRNVVGTNGVGSSLSNIFSKYFEVESADKKNWLHCSWSNNMQTINDDLEVKKCSDHFTKITFDLDFDKFTMSEKSFSDDFISIIHKRCIDAAVANLGLKVTFICDDFKEVWKFKSFDDYLDLYSDYINKEDKIDFKNDLCEAIVFPDSTVDIAFVNGAECSKGTHIRALRNEINNSVVEYLQKKDKLKDLTTRMVDGRYSIFMNINVSNPTYDSQTKEVLTNPIESFSKDPSKKWEVSEKFLNKILKSEIIELVRDWYSKRQNAEDEKTLRKLNKEAKNTSLKRPDKYIPANSKNKKDRCLLIFEGDSAATGIRNARDPQTQGAYLMRGVPLNCLGMSPIEIMKNEVFNDIITILGLEWGKDFDINKMKYDKIVIATDADVDGDRICSLLCVFFYNWPELFAQHKICRLIAPIIIATKGKITKYYYKIEDFDKESKQLKGFNIKYAKGLGGQNPEQYKKMVREPIYMYFTLDSVAKLSINQWFGEDADIRKKLMYE